MSLTEKHRPQSLDGIVGQDRTVRLLKRLVAEPTPCCIALVGPTGTGKTATAYAFAHELGCYRDKWWETVYSEDGASFDMATMNHYFKGNESPFSLRAPGGWHVLVIEELERLHPNVQNKAKDAWERVLGSRRVILVATSNDMSRLEKALRHRFKTYEFKAGRSFADAAQNRLYQIWQQEAPGTQPPITWGNWGWEDEEFSMRLALSQMQDELDLLEEGVAA